jgi:hypothetical protein
MILLIVALFCSNEAKLIVKPPKSAMTVVVAKSATVRRLESVDGDGGADFMANGLNWEILGLLSAARAYEYYHQQFFGGFLMNRSHQGCWGKMS